MEFEGHAAQIDHLLINRFLEIYVCESKRFAEGIGFNEHGEFYRYAQGKPYAIESPIEQNNRHILLLKRLFDSGEIDLPTRLGFRMKPSLHSLILIANTSAIRRPKNSKKVDGMDRIIKVEQLVKRRDQDLKEENFLHTFSSVNKLISTETLQILAENLADLHTPAKKNWKARFGIEERPSETGELGYGLASGRLQPFGGDTGEEKRPLGFRLPTCRPGKARLGRRRNAACFGGLRKIPKARHENRR